MITLTEACQRGDIEEVKKAIQGGAKPDAVTLTFACATRSIEIVDLVLAAQAQPDSDTLAVACATNEIAIVAKVIARGAKQTDSSSEIAEEIGNQEIKNLHSRAPSSYSQGNLKTDLVRQAQLRNVLPPAFTRYTLLQAVKTGNPATIEAVIKAGALPHEDPAKENELNLACLLDAKIFETVANIPGIKPDSKTLSKAFQSCKMEIVDAVLRLKARPGSDTLSVALMNHWALGKAGFEKAIACDAQPDSESLSLAFATGDPQIVDKVLSLEAKPNKNTLSYALKFHWMASGKKRIETVIALGALPNSQSLSLAFDTGDMEIVDKVISLDAKTDDETLNKALNLWKKFGKEGVEKVIALGAKPDSKTLSIAFEINMEIVDRVLSLDAKPDSNTLYNALFFLGKKGAEKAIALDAKPDSRTLTRAFATANMEIVEMIVRLEATPDDETLNTAFKYLGKKGAEKAIALGAKPNSSTLTRAFATGNMEIVEMIVPLGATPDGDTLNTALSPWLKLGTKGVEKAIALGAKPDGSTQTRAFATGNLEIVEMIVRLEATPDSETLNEALLHLGIEGLEKAIALGAKPNDKILSAAFQTGNMEIVDRVLSLLPNAKTDSETLNKALRYIGKEGVEKAIALGAKPNDKTLSEAFETGKMELVDRVAGLDAKPDSETLSKALRYLGKEGAEKAIALGAKPDDKTLTLAFETASMEIVDRVAGLGAVPDSRTLNKAIYYLRKEGFERAIALGAKPDENTLSEALNTGEKEIVDKVLQMGVKVEKDLFNTLIRKGVLVKGLEAAIAAGIKPDEETLDLVLESSDLNLTKVVFLIKNGARPSAKSISVFSKNSISSYETFILINLLKAGAKPDGESFKKWGMISDFDVLSALAKSGLRPTEAELQAVDSKLKDTFAYRWWKERLYENSVNGALYHIPYSKGSNQIVPISKLQKCIKGGEKPNDQTLDIAIGMIPLIQTGSPLEIILIVIKAGAKPSAKTLTLAAKCTLNKAEYTKLLQQMIAAGAQPDQGTARAIQWDLIQDNELENTLRQMVEGVKINSPEFNLIIGFSQDSDQVCQALRTAVSAGQKPNEESLEIALKTGKSAIVLEVIKAGAPPSPRALELAFSNSLTEVYIPLIQSIQATGANSLNWACQLNQPKMVAFVRAQGVLPDEKTEGIARSTNNPEIVSLVTTPPLSESVQKDAMEVIYRIDDTGDRLDALSKKIAEMDPALNAQAAVPTASTAVSTVSAPSKESAASTASIAVPIVPAASTAVPTVSTASPDVKESPAAQPALTSLSASSKEVADDKVGAHLMQKVQEEAKRLASQTIADCQAMLAQMKQEMQQEMEKNQLKQAELVSEIARLRKELLKAQGETSADLEKRIAELEKNQSFLMQDYEVQQAILAEREFILKQQDLTKFYRSVQNKLQELFLAYKVIGSGLVVNNALSTADKAIQAIALAGESIPLPGSQAVATWLGYAIQAGVWLANKKAGDDDDRRVGNITELVVSFQELDYLTETIARRLTATYQEQLHDLDLDSVAVLGESSVKLMVAYLWSGVYSALPLNEQLTSCVVKVRHVENSKGFFQKLTQKYEKLKGKFTDTKLTSKSGEQWTAYSVFQCPGIETADNECYSGQGTQPETYGYRLGSKEEAVAAKLVLDPKRVERSKKLSPSTVEHLRQVTDAAKALQMQVEYRQKHMQVKTHQPTSTAREIGKGVLIDGLTLIVDRMDLPDERAGQVNELLERAKANCPEENIKKNSNNEIISINFTAAIFMERLVNKLTLIFSK